MTLTAIEADELVRRTEVALARHAEGWIDFYDIQMRSMQDAIAHIDDALVALERGAREISALDPASKATLDFELGPDEFPTIESFAKALADCHTQEPPASFAARFKPQIGPKADLWSCRERLRLDLARVMKIEEIDRAQITPLLEASRCHISNKSCRLIAELCAAWFDCLGELGLPRKDRGRENPLLRYLTVTLKTALDEEPPRSEALINLIAKRVRPLLVERSRVDHTRRKSATKSPR
ncbi:hypothetical protein [Fulvimarina manganoxydans]|uniref:hypothetical protein n=1 Tax=Fulvimarina manganoxydans TaxID=937218 RepID=UPI000A0604E4|nr:hypothetical protein [Fulvimarina manganoxydans]